MTDGTITSATIANWKSMMAAVPIAPRIVENSLLMESYEDWSQVRSPSRARRRMKLGHRQRVRYLQRPMRKGFEIDGVIYVHPEILREMKRSLAKRIDRDLEASFMGSIIPTALDERSEQTQP